MKKIFITAFVLVLSLNPSCVINEKKNSFINVNLFKELENLVDKAKKFSNISIRANKEIFKIGEKLIISCEAKENGYLNILSINEHDKEAVVLYPNKFHVENYVEKGKVIQIPENSDNFEVFAREPKGKYLIIGFFTKEKINAYEDSSQAIGNFKYMANKSFGRFAVEEKNQQENKNAGLPSIPSQTKSNNPDIYYSNISFGGEKLILYIE